MKRYYKSGSQWCEPWKQKVGAAFNESLESAATALSAQWGVPIQAFDYEDDAPDPRTGELLNLTPPPPPPTEPPIESMTAAEIAASSPPNALAAAKTILAKADADITAAEIKTLVLLMARYFYRK